MEVPQRTTAERSGKPRTTDLARGRLRAIRSTRHVDGYLHIFVLKSIDMMVRTNPELDLGPRLERLTGEDADCCVPEYAALGSSARSSKGFSSALRRAKSLADEHRLLAVALLKRRRELCACEIQAATGLNHATVSHHMSVLEGAGLVSHRRKGKWIYYRLTGSPEVKVP